MDFIKKYISSMDDLTKDEIEKYNNTINKLNEDNVLKLNILLQNNLPRLIVDDILYSLFKHYFEIDDEYINYDLSIHLMIWLDFLNIPWN